MKSNVKEITIWWSEEDEAYLAKDKETGFTCHGDTEAEAVKELFFVLELYEQKKIKSENGINIKNIIKKLEKHHGCNCDLDNWQPTIDTGHSSVCRIHKMARYILQHKIFPATEDLKKMFGERTKE